MFFRFKPETYWYVLVHIVRSLLLAIAPIIPNVILQLILMQVVMSVQLSITAMVKPWRLESANFFEQFLTQGVLLMVFIAGTFVHDEDADAGAWLGMIIVALP